MADAVAANEDEAEGSGASVGVDLPSGSSRFDFVDKRVEATCMDDRHKTADGTRCRLTRVGFLGEYMPDENGRPIRTMAAWLADSFTMLTREMHGDPFYIISVGEQKRKDARQQVLCMPCGPELAKGERPRKWAEPEEPKSVPMGFKLQKVV